MGQAIVYCWKCQNQIREADFDAGRAFEFGDRACCSGCTDDFVATLPPREREHLLSILSGTPAWKGRTGSHASAKKTRRAGADRLESTSLRFPTAGAGGPRGSQRTLKLALALGGVLLLAGILFLWNGSGKGEIPPSSREPESKEAQPRTEAGKSGPETAAQAAVQKAQQASLNRTDLDAQLLLWNKAVAASERTALLPQAMKERDLLLVRQKEAYAKELAQVVETIEGLERQREYSKAVTYLRSVRSRHPNPEWTLPVDGTLVAALEKEKSADLAERASRSIPREALALWLRGDAGIILNGSRVSRWSDQSEGHRDALEETEARQPAFSSEAVSGKPALSFDGSRTSMKFPMPVNGLGGMTVFLVSTCLRDCPAGSGSDASALYWDAKGPAGKIYLGAFQSTLRLKFGAGKPNSDLSFKRPSSLSTRPSLSVMEKAGPVDRLYVNGVLSMEQAGMGASVADCGDEGYLGIGKNDTHFTGCIAELLIYTKALADPERQRIEQVLMGKYGLPAK